MRKSCKRLLMLICCITLALTLTTVVSAVSTENCPGSCTHQAAIGTTHYDTLAEAFTAATDDCTVTLLCDITGVTPLVVDKAVTLDLGSKTVTGQIADTDALFTVSKDFTLKNGTVVSDAGTVLLASNCAVTIEKTVKLQAATAIALMESGKLEITGGEITSKENAIVLNIADKKTMEASITGGKFQVENGDTIVLTAGTDATAPEEFVIGGTYNKLPTEFIPDYCRVTDNGDGTYTVTAEYAITYTANGASGTMAATKADRGTTVTLPACSFTAPAGKHFKSWQIDSKEYAPGATIEVNGPVNLTAMWDAHSGGSATCTSRAVCSTCGNSYGDFAFHNYYAVSAYAATCSHSGMNAHNKCSVCGQLFVSGIPIRASSLTIPAIGHRMEKVEGKDATCTEDGVAAYEKCASCGLLQLDGMTVSEDDLIIPAAGHEYNTIPAVEATCTQPGTKAHEVCTRCGELSLKGKAVEADVLVTEVNAHVLSDWQNDEATHWKSCTQCGEVFRQHSHKDSDGNEACDDCGHNMPAPTEVIPAVEEDNVSFPFLIPVIVAVVIAVGGALMVAYKKRKE